MRKLLLAVVALSWSGALAAAPPTPPPASVLSGQVAVSASSSSGASPVQLPSAAASADVLTLFNSGTKDAFCAHGLTSSVVATTSSPLVPAGTSQAYWIGGDQYVACVTNGSDTTTVVIFQGNGSVQLSKLIGSSGGGAGTVTEVDTGTGLIGGPITGSGTVSLGVPVTVAHGGTNATSAGGTALDNVSGFSSTGLVNRTGAGTYAFKTAPSGAVVGDADAQTLTNKTISGASNTLSAIANAALTNSSITVAGQSTALGGSVAASTMDFSTAPAIGGTASAAGAFTTLSASGAVSGSGFSTYLASPPAVGGTAAAAGSFTALTATSSFTATGLVTLGDLASQAANTVLSNATSGSASPTAFAMPSCSGATSALIWTTSAGFGCNTISAGSGNAVFGTTTGNTANDVVIMSNTTTGIADSGVLYTALAPKASPTLSGTVTGPDSGTWTSAGLAAILSEGVAGNITSAAWTTSGLQSKVAAATLTDNSSTGTVAAIYNNVIGGSTIATPTNSVTCTQCVTLDVEPPVAGNHLTFSAAYAARFNGNILVGNGSAAAPSITFTGGNTTGIYSASNGNIDFSSSGSNRFQISGGNFNGANASSGGFFNVAASATTPTFAPLQGATTTGIGAAASGSLDIINAGTDMLRTTNGHFYDIGGATASINETGSLCYNSGSTPANEVLLDTVAGGCVSSLEEFKNIEADIDPTQALSEVMEMKPFWYTWNQKTHPSTDRHVQPGLGAHAIEAIDPRLAGYTDKGQLYTVRYEQMTAVLVAAIQEQQSEIDTLRSRFQ